MIVFIILIIWISYLFSSQCLLTIAYILSGEAVALLEYIGFVSCLICGTAIGVLPYLRWKEPDKKRPFKVSTNTKTYIPPYVFFVLRWQSSPTQMKCTCNASESTHILYGIFNQNKEHSGFCCKITYHYANVCVF